MIGREREHFEQSPKRVGVIVLYGVEVDAAIQTRRKILIPTQVEALKKGQNVRLPGLLDERIEDCGPNRNCFAAVKRERNASRPPLEEFLSRFLGT